MSKNDPEPDPRIRTHEHTPPGRLAEVIRTFIHRTNNKELAEILRKLYGELKLKEVFPPDPQNP